MDQLFKEALDQIEINRQKEWAGIPMGMGRLDSFIPYIEKKRYILLFGASGVGKSKMGIKKFLIDPFLFHKETGYKTHIIYFSLEMPRHDIITQVISYFYYLKYGEKHAKEFFSRDKPTDAIMQKVFALEDYFLHFSEVVDIVDTIHNPTGLYKYARSYFEANGVDKKISEFRNEYVPNDDTHVIILSDTLNALHEESGKTKFQTIFDYSLKYQKNRIVDYYGATSVNIQQQDKSSEQAEFTMKGGKIEYKTLPNRSGLAECKQTFNDADIVYSLYSPHLYSIDRYPFEGREPYYDITTWEDNFRVWNIQKNRHGVSAKEIGIYFDGAVCDVQCLPLPIEFHKDRQLISRYLG